MKTKIYKILAIISIVAGLALTIYNYSLDRQAGALSKEVLVDLKSQVLREERLSSGEEDLTFPKTTIDGVDFFGRLFIPALDRDLPLAWDYTEENLKKFPVRFKGDTYKDPLIIMAHNYKSHFGPLRKLKKGDDLIFTDAFGRSIHYKVDIMEVIDGNDFDGMINTDYDLTLFTCTLERTSRFTIRAKRCNI